MSSPSISLAPQLPGPKVCSSSIIAMHNHLSAVHIILNAREGNNNDAGGFRSVSAIPDVRRGEFRNPSCP